MQKEVSGDEDDSGSLKECEGEEEQEMEREENVKDVAATSASGNSDVCQQPDERLPTLK